MTTLITCLITVHRSVHKWLRAEKHVLQPWFELKCGQQKLIEADYAKSLRELKLAPRASLIVQTTFGCHQGEAGTFRLAQAAANGDVDIDDLSYEQLLQLEKQVGQVKINTASHAAVASLSSFIYSSSTSSSSVSTTAHESSSPPSTSSEVPESLPQLSRQLSIGSQSCGICREDFTPGDECRSLPCFEKHVFHAGCIDEWLLKYKRSCPICLKNLDEQ